MTMTNPEDISDALMRFVEDSELSQRQIALQAGITPAVLNRFLRQGGGMSRDGLDRLCRVLGLQLVQTGKTPKSAALIRKGK